MAAAASQGIETSSAIAADVQTDGPTIRLETASQVAAPQVDTTEDGGSAPAGTVAPSITSNVRALSVTASNPLASPRPITNIDVLAELDPNKTFASLGWKWSIECGGQWIGGLNVPESGIKSSSLGDQYGALRFGKVADPANAMRSVLFFRANKSDPLVAGVPRCEASTSTTAGGAIPTGTPVWFAFGIRLSNWIQTPDEQIFAQWHQGDGSTALSPFLAMSVQGGVVRVLLRHNSQQILSKSTTTTVVALEQSPLPLDRWSYFVIKALISPDGSLGSYVTIWRDGAQVVNYHGPFGYRYPGFSPYLKIGHYHWLNTSNPWPTAAATRTLMMRSPVLVSDKTNVYAEPDLRAHVTAR